jgi:uncharacterized protein YbjT (DUF2867 family)
MKAAISQCCATTAERLDVVHVIGASGRSGRAVCRALLTRGRQVVPIVRDAAKWAATGIAVDPRIADLTAPAALGRALADATAVVSCAHARQTAAILAAVPEPARCVLLGSTRQFSRWPDAHGAGVVAGEAAWLASGRHGVMLHPTMIYGAEGEDNVQRLAALLRRIPFVPLPEGGRALVQPIHQDDVTRCILAALDRSWTKPHAIVVAGPVPVAYADFVRAVAAAAGLARPRIVSVPLALVIAGAALSAVVPGIPTIRPAEARRLVEDKAFDILPLETTLSVRPIALADGLARTFSAADNLASAREH